MLSKYFLEDSDIYVCNKDCSNVHKYPANPITNQPNQSNKKQPTKRNTTITYYSKYNNAIYISKIN